jgi:hypothetical protein
VNVAVEERRCIVVSAMKWSSSSSPSGTFGFLSLGVGTVKVMDDRASPSLGWAGIVPL